MQEAPVKVGCRGLAKTVVEWVWPSVMRCVRKRLRLSEPARHIVSPSRELTPIAGLLVGRLLRRESLGHSPQRCERRRAGNILNADRHSDSHADRGRDTASRIHCTVPNAPMALAF